MKKGQEIKKNKDIYIEMKRIASKTLVQNESLRGNRTNRKSNITRKAFH